MKKMSLILMSLLLLFSCIKNKPYIFSEKKGYFEIRNENGIPQYIKYYSNTGKVNGGEISFMDNGNVRSFTYLKNDTITIGPSVRFYDTGKINYFDSYIDGKKEGVSVHYTSKGILTRKSYYRNGVQDGEQYLFDYDSGDTLKIEIYKKGKLIDSILYPRSR